MMIRLIRVAAVAIMLAVAGPFAMAAPPTTTPGRNAERGPVPGLDDTRIQMIIAQQDLIRTLEVLSEQTQLKITATKGLKGTTQRLRIDGTARQALDTVADQVAAVWWWNGSEIRLAARNDIATQTIKTRDLNHVTASARAMGMPVDLLTIARIGGGQQVRVTGPAGLAADFAGLNDDVNAQMSVINMTRFGRRKAHKIE